MPLSAALSMPKRPYSIGIETKSCKILIINIIAIVMSS
jgi:hypothetical protein